MMSMSRKEKIEMVIGYLAMSQKYELAGRLDLAADALAISEEIAAELNATNPKLAK